MSDIGARISQLSQLPPQEILARVSTILPPWVSVILVIAIAWQIANVVWLLVPSETDTLTAGPAGPAPAGQANQGASGGTDVQTIINAHLFGDYNPAQTAVETDPVDAPETKLSLELRGTIAADVADQALAIIAEKGGDEHVYAIGDAVPGNASLHSVYPDRVLLRRAGRLETLRLPRADETSTGGGTLRRRQVTTPSATSSLRDLVNQNPARITDVIRPQPVFRDGQQQGYRVYPGRQRQQFSQLGLRPGDLITQINGMSLDDPARGMEIFRSLGEATQVSVTVERNGQTEILTLDTSQLQDLGEESDRGSSRDEDR